MCNELGWLFTAGQLEKRMKELDSYESWVQAWCRRLGEELATKDSVLDHWELACRVHKVAGVPWVRGQRPSEAKLQPWKDGDRWVLPTRPDGKPCCEGIIAALAGEVRSSAGTPHNVRLADYAPTDVGSAASEGLSPVTAAESSDSGAVSDGLRTDYTDQVVSANHFDIPPVPSSSGPVSCYNQSAGPVSYYKEGTVSAPGSGAITAPQPGSDPSAQFGAEKKKGPAHWN
jgi:hypothetical protein